MAAVDGAASSASAPRSTLGALTSASWPTCSSTRSARRRGRSGAARAGSRGCRGSGRRSAPTNRRAVPACTSGPGCGRGGRSCTWTVTRRRAWRSGPGLTSSTRRCRREAALVTAWAGVDRTPDLRPTRRCRRPRRRRPRRRGGRGRGLGSARAARDRRSALDARVAAPGRGPGARHLAGLAAPGRRWTTARRRPRARAPRQLVSAGCSSAGARIVDRDTFCATRSADRRPGARRAAETRARSAARAETADARARCPGAGRDGASGTAGLASTATGAGFSIGTPIRLPYSVQRAVVVADPLVAEQLVQHEPACATSARRCGSRR